MKNPVCTYVCMCLYMFAHTEKDRRCSSTVLPFHISRDALIFSLLVGGALNSLPPVESHLNSYPMTKKLKGCKC